MEKSGWAPSTEWTQQMVHRIVTPKAVGGTSRPPSAWDVLQSRSGRSALPCPSFPGRGMLEQGFDSSALLKVSKDAGMQVQSICIL